MKSIVIYYSWTGNTKQIAEAIYSGMKKSSEECDIARLQDVDINYLTNYDLIGLGSLVIDFKEPATIKDFIHSLPSLRGKYGFSFCTHGTCPGTYISGTVRALRKKGLTITGWNDWYGSVFIPYMPKPYYTDGHPDEIDLIEAKDFGKDIVERTRSISRGESRLIPRLPRKEQYDRIYGNPSLINVTDIPDDEKWWKDMSKFIPKINVEKCKYPKCKICIDNCPTHSINPSESPSISQKTCEPCQLWFCE